MQLHEVAMTRRRRPRPGTRPGRRRVSLTVLLRRLRDRARRLDTVVSAAWHALRARWRRSWRDAPTWLTSLTVWR